MGMGGGVGALAGLGFAIHEGEKQERIARRNLQAQERAQKQVERRSISEQRLGAFRENAARKKTPNIASLLQAESISSKQGPAASMLRGPGSESPLLGRRTALGS